MFLALKELVHSKGRFIMIGLIIVLISWLVFILSGLGTGLADLAAGTLKRAEANAVVFEEGADMSLSKSMLSESISDNLLRQKGVSDTAPISTFSTSIRKSGTSEESGKKTDAILIGIEPGSFIEPTPTEGKHLADDAADQVLVDSSLKNDGFAIGDTLALSGSTEKLTIGGFTDHQTLNHQPAIFVNLDQFRMIRYAAPGSDNGIEDIVNGILVQGKDIDLNELTKADEHIEAGSKKAAVNAVPGYSAENATITMMLWFLMIISAFILGVFFYVLTNQKTQQFGVLKAIGGSNGFIIRSVISQVFVLSLVSVMIGIGLTYLTTLFLPEAMPFHLEVPMVMIYSIVLLLISLISSLFSVVKIAKIDPLTALGRVE